MLVYIMLSALIGAAPVLESEPEPAVEVAKAKEIMRVLKDATDDYKKWVDVKCGEEDAMVADLAARGAALTEERAIRTRNLSKIEQPDQRDRARRSAAKLFIEAADFWLKAAECHPSRAMYLDHAELPLVDAEALVTADALDEPLRVALGERRAQLVVARGKQRTSDSEAPERPLRCSAPDGESAQLNVRLAVRAEERAGAAMRTTKDGATGTNDEAARSFIESARLWVWAWECRTTAISYLEHAERSLDRGESAASVVGEAGSATEARIREVRALIDGGRMWATTDRFSLRVDFGYGTGRLARAKRTLGYEEKDLRSHAGGYLSASLMARLRLKSGVVTLLVGPYFSYWRAMSQTGIPAMKDASVSEFGTKVEVSLAFTPRVARIFTLHPGLEVGLQYVDFNGSEGYQGSLADDPDLLVDPDYVDIAGGTIGISVGACFLHSSLCAMFRMHSVPTLWNNKVPTLQGGFGVDFFRLAHAILTRPGRKGRATMRP